MMQAPKIDSLLTATQNYWFLSRCWNQVSNDNEPLYNASTAMDTAKRIIGLSAPERLLHKLAENLYVDIIHFGSKTQKRRRMRKHFADLEASSAQLIIIEGRELDYAEEKINAALELLFEGGSHLPLNKQLA